MFGTLPTSGSLFSNNASGSLFDTKNSTSLFGPQTSIFEKKPAANEEAGSGGNSPSGDNYENEAEPPSVTLDDQVATQSPFSKIFEKEV